MVFQTDAHTPEVYWSEEKLLEDVPVVIVAEKASRLGLPPSDDVFLPEVGLELRYEIDCFGPLDGLYCTFL